MILFYNYIYKRDFMKAIEFCKIETTYIEDEVGEDIIKALLAQKLAACIQVHEIGSFYHWDGELNTSTEKLLVIKTTEERYESVEAEILRYHNYETPEIIKIPITGGYQDYLDWVKEEVKTSDSCAI